jgi:hypothetical protein
VPIAWISDPCHNKRALKLFTVRFFELKHCLDLSLETFFDRVFTNTCQSFTEPPEIYFAVIHLMKSVCGNLYVTSSVKLPDFVFVNVVLILFEQGVEFSCIQSLGFVVVELRKQLCNLVTLQHLLFVENVLRLSFDASFLQVFPHAHLFEKLAWLSLERFLIRVECD